uniref:Uncharacterized protein n=1 Tax=Pelusios castaneus TaxID=367368 RepID=A0A8C8VPB5_9SAUR
MFDNGNFRRKRKRRSEPNPPTVASSARGLKAEERPILAAAGKPCENSSSPELEPSPARDHPKSSSSPGIISATPGCLSTFFSGMSSLSSGGGPLAGAGLPSELHHRTFPSRQLSSGTFTPSSGSSQEMSPPDQLQRVSGPPAAYYNSFHPSSSSQGAQYNHYYNFTVNSLIYTRDGTEV